MKVVATLLLVIIVAGIMWLLLRPNCIDNSVNELKYTVCHNKI